MKRSTVVSLLACVALMLAGCGGGGTAPSSSRPSAAAVSGTPASLIPSALAFLDADHGLVAGRMVDANGTLRRASTVQATFDGGRSWHTVYSTSGPIYSLTALGSDLAWAVVGRSYPGGSDTMLDAPTTVQGPSQLLASSDGGESWHPLGQAVSGLAAVTFVSRQVGWAMRLEATGWTVVKTADGGRTWRSLGHPCPAGTQGAVVSFVSQSRGWLLCTSQPGAGEQPRELLETTNGGQGWRTEAGVWPSSNGLTSAGGGLGSGGYPSSVFFLPNGHGWLGLNYAAAVLGTNDAGRSWHQLGTRPLSVYQAGPLWFLNDADGFALAGDGDSHELLSTADGGSTWVTVHAWTKSGGG